MSRAMTLRASSCVLSLFALSIFSGCGGSSSSSNVTSGETTSGGEDMSDHPIRTTIPVPVPQPAIAREDLSEPLQQFWGELDTLSRRHPGGIHVLNVITEATGMPDHHARELLRLQFETMRGRVLALAIVLEKRGVLASLSRAVLSTVLVLSRRPFPMKIHVEYPNNPALKYMDVSYDTEAKVTIEPPIK
jgi:hypothetical protein